MCEEVNFIAAQVHYHISHLAAKKKIGYYPHTLLVCYTGTIKVEPGKLGPIPSPLAQLWDIKLPTSTTYTVAKPTLA